jgi:DNA-binding transcriptional regulator YbjK
MGEPKRAGRGASQRRSRERREQLLQAALALLEHGGAKAVTHRAVSQAAGVPPATAGYYFPAAGDLVTAAVAFHVQQRVDYLRAISASTQGRDPMPALEFARDTAERLATGRAYVTIADYEVVLEAARNPGFRPVANAARSDVEQLFIDYCRSIGAVNPGPAGRAHLALIDGLGLQQLAFGTAPVAIDTVADAFAALFAHHRASDAARERTRESLRAPLTAPLEPMRLPVDPESAPGASPGGGRGASQQRSRERREQLLTATIELFEAGGSKAITHRAVSQAAGLPPATAGYYFPQIEDLVAQAVEFHVRSRLDVMGSMIDSIRASVTTPLDLIEQSSRAMLHADAAVSTTHVELFLEAARRPEFRPIAAAARHDSEVLAADYSAQLGARDPAGAGSIALAFTDGVALRRLAVGGDEADVESMVDGLVALMHFFRASDAERQAIRESLGAQLPIRANGAATGP